ncbi:MAG: sodium-dependent transporter, partial [Hyphomonadaceae bacterium]
AERSEVSTNWSVLGWTGMIASFLIVSFYCVVAAWVIMYIPKFLFGAFDGQTPEQISGQFDTTISTPLKVLPYFTGFALLTTWLVSRGVNKGIEWASKILMPMFFALLILLAIYSLYTGFSTEVIMADGSKSNGTTQALAFLFSPDWGKVDAEVVTAALGQAFFSIGLGSAIMITYGSYLPKEINIPKSALIVGLTDTFVALVAGLAIFPIVFSHGLAPNSGAGLFFNTLPIALHNAPGGTFIGAGFFFLAIFAAVTSSISLLEPITAWVSERFNQTKAKAAWIMGGCMWLLGMGSIFGVNSGIGDDGEFFIDTYFMDFIDGKLTSAIMLPLTGLLTVLFVGWRMKKSMVEHEMSNTATGLLFILIRYIAPIAVAAVLLFGIWNTYIVPMMASGATPAG